MTASFINHLSGALGLLMFVGTIVFLALYWKCSMWRESPLGRHMLYFTLAFALVLAIRIVGLFWEGLPWLPYVRIVSYLFLVIVVWQRVWLLVKALRRGTE